MALRSPGALSLSTLSGISFLSWRGREPKTTSQRDFDDRMKFCNVLQIYKSQGALVSVINRGTLAVYTDVFHLENVFELEWGERLEQHFIGQLYQLHDRSPGDSNVSSGKEVLARKCTRGTAWPIMNGCVRTEYLPGYPYPYTKKSGLHSLKTRPSSVRATGLWGA